MTVRAKFSVDEIRITRGSRKAVVDGKESWESCEMRTVIASPVYGGGDPNHENTKFWQASPSGKLELSIINPEAWPMWEVGKQFYVDFTPAA